MFIIGCIDSTKREKYKKQKKKEYKKKTNTHTKWNAKFKVLWPFFFREDLQRGDNKN